MKLRRALATAAATAVIAPLALLTVAPAAFADGETSDTSSTGPSPTDTATDTVTPPPSDTESESTEPAPPPSDTSLPESNTSSSATGSPSATASEPGDDEPSEPAGPSEEPGDPNVPFCEDLDEDYDQAKVSAGIKGLPGKIVAGDGFHAFELTVTNDSAADVKNVAFYAEVENYELDEAKFLSPYVDLQFKNPENGKWERIGDESWSGDYFFFVDALKSNASQSVDLRVSIDAKAPAGDAYSFGSGAYLDNIEEQDCIAEGWVQYDFQVLDAGAQNPDPGTADPSDDDKGSGSVKKPQGDVSALPTGNLAETGSSSALPVIGLVGGIAVVAGAGAVFAVKRRKAGADA
ncbi:LAETG motif-containing sortase-dependent surface protein [Streptomyces sp. NPDC088387]|uniref:LAETG motif-containing sortase-dependent surface protein n=1 Tax=Streptomyces sp. NPDC088387 TaxID=3365859 RepID=UPI0037F788D4